MRCAGGHLADGDQRAAAKQFVLGVVQLAIGLGQLLGKSARLFANLCGAQGQTPSGAKRGQFSGLWAQSLGLAGFCAPDYAADAGGFGFQADPIALIGGQSRGNAGQYPFESLIARNFGLDEMPQAIEFAQQSKPIRVGIAPGA